MSTFSLEADELAKRTLGDGTHQAPASYTAAVTSLLATNPQDTNFRLTLGKEDSVGCYGVVTCLERYCSKKVVLDPDPRTPIVDQRGIGFGSLTNYKMHCLDPSHLKGRKERCRFGPSEPGAENVPPNPHKSLPSASQSSLRFKEQEDSTSMPQKLPKIHPHSQSSLLSALDRIDSGQSGRSAEDKPTISSSWGLSLAAYPQKAIRQSRPTSQDATPLKPRKILPTARHLSPAQLGTSANPVLIGDDEKTDDDDEEADDDIVELVAPSRSSFSTSAPAPRGHLRPFPEFPDHEQRDTKVLDLTKSSPSSSRISGRSSLEEIKPLNAFNNRPSSELQGSFKTPQLPQNDVRARYETELGLLEKILPRVPSFGAKHLIERINTIKAFLSAGVVTWFGPSSMVHALVPGLFDITRPWRHEDKIRADSAMRHPVKLEALGSPVWPPKTEINIQNAVAGPSRFNPNQQIYSSNPWQRPLPEELGSDPWGEGEAADPFAWTGGDLSYLDFGHRRPDDLQAFFSSALNSFDEDQDVDKALRYLGLADIQQRFRALAVPLMPHQVLGVQFMLQQEKKASMRGGILADAMGLGKTLSSIATIVGNPSTDRHVRTTLVVAPLALLQQWKSEIETRITTPVRVLIHWGPKRSRRPVELKQYDVVLTTYGILASESGQDTKVKRGKQRKRDLEDDSASEAEATARPAKKGPLFQVHWYRVILDEAHIIRNRRTRGAVAAFELHAKLRWCLTGTPVVNSLSDLYPLLHFTGISPQREWKSFHQHIAVIEKRRPNLATKRAQAILKPCTMRRNKDSTLNGVRLLNLPEKTTTWDELTLDAEERHIYDSIEKRMQIKFNSLLKRGTVLKHYSVVLVMLVRLKQATCHPWLLTRRPEDAAHPEDIVISDEELMGSRDAALVDDMGEIQRALGLLGQDFVDRVTAKLEERNQSSSDSLDIECAICFEPFEHEHDERVTQCLHSFCKACTEELFNSPVRTADLTEAQQADGMRQCPMCRSALGRQCTFRASAFFNPLAGSDNEAKGSPSSTIGKHPRADEDEDVKPDCKRRISGKGKAKAIAKIEDNAPDGDRRDVVDLEGLEIKPSTKMKRLLSVIEEKLQDPTCKIVAYSQFTSYLDLCGSFLRSRGISNMQYQGSLGAAERQQVLDRFNTPVNQPGGDCRVLLLSLKAGGVGLNLTVANVVVALDLAWNAATEDQAVDRCHRIGQVKPVDVRRLVIQDTIDERIKALQETKRQLADGALGEGTTGKLGRLTVNDLIRLFNVDGSGDDY